MARAGRGHPGEERARNLRKRGRATDGGVYRVCEGEGGKHLCLSEGMKMTYTPESKVTIYYHHHRKKSSIILLEKIGGLLSRGCTGHGVPSMFKSNSQGSALVLSITPKRS